MDNDDDSWRELSLVERHDFLLRTGQMSDCSFVLQQADGCSRQYQVHKFPLCCASPVFAAMLLGPLACADCIHIEDVQPLHFGLMLQFIYTESVDLQDMETALGVCRVADKYLVKPLVKLCSTFIDDFISSENVCKVLEFARFINNSSLEQSCLCIIRRTLNLVVESESFLEVDRSILILLLEQENLCIASECHLFLACVRWAVANQTADCLRHVLGPEILSSIRFKSFSCEQFVSHVIPTKILTESEDRQILINLVSPGEMPLGFSNREPRVLGLIEKLELSQKYPTFESYSNCKQTKWELTFSPRNSVVCIHGVQLKAARYGGDNLYHECLTVTMSHQEFEVALGKFQGKVRSGAAFDVYFEQPFLAQPYNYYTIHVDYSNHTYNYLCNISKHKVYIAGTTIQLKIDEHEFLHVSAIYLNEHTRQTKRTRDEFRSNSEPETGAEFILKYCRTRLCNKV